MPKFLITLIQGKSFQGKCHSLLYIFGGMLLMLNFLTCNTLESSSDMAIARVGDVYLYRSDISAYFNSFKNTQDSIIQVQKFIDSWAREQLLYQQAQINIGATQRQDLERLIRQYETALYGQVYKESIVTSGMDTLVGSADIARIYNTNKAMFVLKEPIYQFRSLQLPLSNVDQYEIKKRFRRFDSLDRQFLDSLSFQFSRYFSNDSIWVNQKVLFEQVKFLNEKNLKRFFKKGKYIEVKDSLNVYLLVGLDERLPNEMAPLSYVKPSLRTIVLNQRKIEFLRKFDNELLQDAMRAKQFEILVP